MCSASVSFASTRASSTIWSIPRTLSARHRHVLYALNKSSHSLVFAAPRRYSARRVVRKLERQENEKIPCERTFAIPFYEAAVVLSRWLLAGDSGKRLVDGGLLFLVVAFGGKRC
jgi:hypothetical protein